MANIHNTGHMSASILLNVVTIIDASVQRGCWKGEEISHIAKMREIFIEAHEQAAEAEATIAQEIEDRNTAEESTEE